MKETLTNFNVKTKEINYFEIELNEKNEIINKIPITESEARSINANLSRKKEV